MVTVSPLKADDKEIKKILITIFPQKHVGALISYFTDGIREYQNKNWETVGIKSGKFVEAATKCLMAYCAQPIPPARQFKAGIELRKLESLSSTYSEIIRIVIPKACLFIYEVVSNRGARHDSDGIDANETDAKAVIPLLSWIISEMIRFSILGTSNPPNISALVESLSEKICPFSEEIDGRPYVNLDGISATKVGLLLLCFKYPYRIERQKLVEAIQRHGFKKNASEIAVHRLKNLVDDDVGEWQLRNIGRQKAETLLGEL